MKHFVWLSLLLVACGDSGRGGTTHVDPDLSMIGVADGDIPLNTSDGGTVSPDVIYAHSYFALYKMDPNTLAVTMVGAFKWPAAGDDMMTDIAVNRDGKLVGVSFSAVYAIEATTAKCQLLSAFGGSSINGLSFLPLDNGQEVLVASAMNGDLFRIEPTTGASTKIGSYSGGISSSGDVVSVTGLGTYATVRTAQSATDWIAKIDPTTGAATLIADTKSSNIWGLGFWKDKLYGFTSAGMIVVISPTTGQTQLISTEVVSWYGAGVKTNALVIQ